MFKLQLWTNRNNLSVCAFFTFHATGEIWTEPIHCNRIECVCRSLDYEFKIFEYFPTLSTSSSSRNHLVWIAEILRSRLLTCGYFIQKMNIVNPIGYIFKKWHFRVMRYLRIFFINYLRYLPHFNKSNSLLSVESVTMQAVFASGTDRKRKIRKKSIKLFTYLGCSSSFF